MLNWIQDWMTHVWEHAKQSQTQNELESFIASKDPKSVGDVEYWTQQYFTKR